MLTGKGALLFSVTILVVLAYAAYEMNTSFSSRARLWGNALIGPGLALAAVQVVREVRRELPLAVPPEAVFTRAALIWAFGFGALLWAVGLQVAIPAFALVYLRVEGHEPWLKAAVYAIVVGLFVYLTFDRLLHIPLPGGAIPLPGMSN